MGRSVLAAECAHERKNGIVRALPTPITVYLRDTTDFVAQRLAYMPHAAYNIFLQYSIFAAIGIAHSAFGRRIRM